MQRQELERRAVANEYTRTDAAVSWIGWHIGELVAVGLPLLLAVTVTWWLLGLSVLAGGVWVLHEARTRREQQQVRQQGALPPAPADQDATDDETAGQATEDAREGKRDKGVSA
ncbi:hypothetical protein BAY59_35465 [Prauserella coralliicola]|nr:hypothetical protein BAY59_35465 [Prauserella coralliicola]